MEGTAEDKLDYRIPASTISCLFRGPFCVRSYPYSLESTYIKLSDSAIVLGLKREAWSLTPTTIGRVEIDQELQLILLGVMNKSLDVLVQAVLEHMARLYNTIWMIGSGDGSTMQDLDMKNEMAKPWSAVNAYWRRHHGFGWFGWGTLVRLIVTLAISISVMLLGAGLNTVGWPKRRWYPDPGREMNLTGHWRDEISIHTPLTSLTRVDWSADMVAGLDLVGGIPQQDENGEPLLTSGAADEIAGAIAASTALYALSRLPGAFRRPPDWLNVYDTPAYITGMQTCTTGFSVQTVSVQSEQIQGLFRYHKDHTPLAKTARGIHGIVQLTGPALSSTCGDLVGDSPPDNGVEIRQPDDGITIFTVVLGPSAGLNFAGTSCSLKFFQALVPVSTWIVDEEAPSMSLHNITAPMDLQILPSDTSPADALIASRLASHFKSMLPMLHGQVPSFGIVPHLVLAARKLQSEHTNFKSEAAALSAVVATLAQQQLSTASWTNITHKDYRIASAPVQWELYGSGPRLKWEWTALTVLFILLMVMLDHIRLLLTFRIQPGAWLYPGGMLRTAHRAPSTLPSGNKALPSVEEVHAAGALRDREDITKNADDMMRYKVTAVEDEWPVFVETQIKPDWIEKRKGLKRRNTSSIPMVALPIMTATQVTLSGSSGPDITINLLRSSASSSPGRNSSPVPTASTFGVVPLEDSRAPSVTSNIPLLAANAAPVSSSESVLLVFDAGHENNVT
jgi:hypothetical protein